MCWVARYPLKLINGSQYIETMDSCFECKKVANTRKCSGCLVVQYCGVKCQRAAWKEHKKCCTELQNNYKAVITNGGAAAIGHLVKVGVSEDAAPKLAKKYAPRHLTKSEFMVKMEKGLGLRLSADGRMWECVAFDGGACAREFMGSVDSKDNDNIVKFFQQGGYDEVVAAALVYVGQTIPGATITTPGVAAMIAFGLSSGWTPSLDTCDRVDAVFRSRGYFGFGHP